MVYRFSLSLTLSILVLGCSPKSESPPIESISAEIPLAERFDPKECGNLRVEATWIGERPKVPPFDEVSLSPQAGWVHRTVPNPHTPLIGPTGGISRVIVYLREVDLKRSKPWTLPDARIILRDTGIDILQPESTSIGLVRRGREIEIGTESTKLQSLRARGVAFFTLMFPPQSSSLKRTMTKDGFVELSNATGMFATRAYLLIQPHPYCEMTDVNGRVQMDQIPDGEYELVCWMPNYQVDRIERDPETGIQVRQFYATPVERVIPIRIERGQTEPVRLSFSQDDFGSPKSEMHNP